MKSASLDPATLSEIIQMALSDHVSFDQIRFAWGKSGRGKGVDAAKSEIRQLSRLAQTCASFW